MKKNLHRIGYSLLLLLLVFTGCKSGAEDPKKLSSDSVGSAEERVALLKPHIKSFTDFADARFELFNVNGFGEERSIPGASSSDYKFAVQIHPSDVYLWIDLIPEVPAYEAKWIKEIAPGWACTSELRYFKRDQENVQLVICEKEGLIFKRVVLD